MPENNKFDSVKSVVIKTDEITPLTLSILLATSKDQDWTPQKLQTALLIKIAQFLEVK